MTATERLRALLTERGVEWRGGLPTETMVEADGLDLLYVALPDGRVRAFIRNYLTPEQAIAATLGETPTPPQLTPPKQPPYDELIESLRRDWDIEASWDGLRRFWYVGLTDEGVRKRDEREVNRLQAENAKLRELVDELYPLADYGAMDASELDRAHDRMRELGIEVDG